MKANLNLQYNKMKFIQIPVIFLLLFVSSLSFARTDSLRAQIAHYAKTKNAKIGVAVMDLERGDTLTINNDHHYPMQSVYKFHLALAILHEVDKGKLSLEKKIKVTKKDLDEDTWSPMRDSFPKGAVFTLGDIIVYAISYSDNNACDILFKILGGTKKANDYIHSLGIKDVAIKATEKQMHGPWDVQYTNWTTPYAAVQLLMKFYKENILSKSSFEFLLGAMTKSYNAPNRMKGKLPKDAIIAHKTGTSGKNKSGMFAAVNDIGIVTLPGGKHIAIAIFVSDSKETFETNEAIIADISKMIWDNYSNNEK
jgi:beta-lactamase class A